MAYVRRRGSQLAIVQGEREPGTGKVSQRILFTLYSKPEALEVLGRGKEGNDRLFRSLLETRYPGVRFDWKEIRGAVAEGMEVLPETYDYPAGRLHASFRQDLCVLTRQLLLADPQWLESSARLVSESRFELEYLADLIRWRLDPRVHREPDEWSADSPYFWRFTLSGGDVPAEAEEDAAAFYERGDYDRAEAVFRLLIDCFEGYAEGWNYLGLVALERRRLERAEECFRKTMELGRRKFPARIAKSRWWSDLDTRPYMRGLRNLTLTLVEAGRFDEALALCDRLEKECFDDVTADTHRASIHLNERRWERAFVEADRMAGLWPEEDFIAAFALFELGRQGDALAHFLHAFLGSPRTARVLAGGSVPKPRDGDDAADDRHAVTLCRALHVYLAKYSGRSRKFFRRILDDPRVGRLLEQKARHTREWRAQRTVDDNRAFLAMERMKTLPFAQSEARALADLVVGKAGAVLQ